MKNILCLLVIALSLAAPAQTITEKQKILYGSCTKDSLLAEPFNKWFSTGYDNYQPDAVTITALKKLGQDNISIEIFFGTWCGDSKREVPRMLKLLNNISFPEKKVSIIAVGDSDSLYKQSPQHQEAGKGIYHVPTFIIYRNGIEINRINEFPALSLEKDLLAILSNQSYTPNYQSFATLRKWLSDGTLADENINTAGLAQQVRQLVRNEHELNGLGYLLISQNKKKEALRVFQINLSLYPESANVVSSLGEGYYENDDYKKAISYLERALELNKAPADVKGILQVLYKARLKEAGK